MLTAKKAISQTVSILGRALTVSDQMAVVKNSGVDRETKDVIRQCLIAAMNYESTSKESLEKSKTMVRKIKEECEISSRTAAFTAASALKLKKWKDVDEMLEYADYSPPVISRSINISSLAQQSKLDEALNELEKVLMTEESIFSTENYCISDEALDSLCEAIKSCPDSTEKMKRFRNLQRMITKYNRRTPKTIDDLLFSALRVEVVKYEEIDDKAKAFVDSEQFETFVRKAPYLVDQPIDKKIE